jgi:hypothetical protein
MVLDHAYLYVVSHLRSVRLLLDVGGVSAETEGPASALEAAPPHWNCRIGQVFSSSKVFSSIVSGMRNGVAWEREK